MSSSKTQKPRTEPNGNTESSRKPKFKFGKKRNPNYPKRANDGWFKVKEGVVQEGDQLWCKDKHTFINADPYIDYGDYVSDYIFVQRKRKTSRAKRDRIRNIATSLDYLQ